MLSVEVVNALVALCHMLLFIATVILSYVHITLDVREFYGVFPIELLAKVTIGLRVSGVCWGVVAIQLLVVYYWAVYANTYWSMYYHI